MKSNIIEMQRQLHPSSGQRAETPGNSPAGSTTNMKIIVRYSGLTKRPMWQQLVETKLKRLQNLARIAKAHVTLEWQHGVKRAFRVLTQLEVPGPDFHAEASDYTLPAAIMKVVKSLERQILARKHRQAGKWKTNLQLGLNPGRSASGFSRA